MVFRVPLDESNTSTRTKLYDVFSFFTDRADMTSVSPSGAFYNNNRVERTFHNNAGGKRGAREYEPNSAERFNDWGGRGYDDFVPE